MAKEQPARRIYRVKLAWIGLLVVACVAGPGGARANREEATGSTLFSVAALPDWLEPRGLSVVDLVGQLPDEILRGSIVSYGATGGVLIYESGTRVADRVVVTTAIYPRVYSADWAPGGLVSVFGCLGQRAIYDHPGSVVPPSTLRLYDSAGRDITERIEFLYVTRMETEQPLADSRQYERYPVYDYGAWRTQPLPMGPEGLEIPANSGCDIQIPGTDYYPLTGVFTIETEAPVLAFVLGSQLATFHSYIGTGSLGIFLPLMQQLRGRYPDRHERIALDVPAGAQYFFVKFPPMPADAYTDQRQATYPNADRLTGGTYRLAGEGGVELSTDLTFSAVFPLATAWQDVDQAPGTAFLPLLTRPDKLAPPEYVVPAGIAYDPCFTRGDCPDWILEQIHEAVMGLEIFYLSIGGAPPAGSWSSLRMAGSAWSPLGASPVDAQSSGQGTARHTCFLPYLHTGPISVPNPPVDCPAGLFDTLGRMLYHCPQP